jgi:hypothetical protein
LIVIDEKIFLLLILTNLGTAGGFFLYWSGIKRWAPEAALFKQARQQKKPLVVTHFQNNTAVPAIPKIQKMEDDDGVVVPFYTIPKVGLKFKDSSGTKAEKWFGDITIYHHYELTPEPISTAFAVAFSQFKDLLRKNKIDIEGMEDVAFYAISEHEKLKDIEETLKSINIPNTETRMKIREMLEYIDKFKKDIQKEKLQSGLYTYQTVVRALDATMAYTSANLAFTKTAIEAYVRQQLNQSSKNLMLYFIGAFILALAAGTFLKLAGAI